MAEPGFVTISGASVPVAAPLQVKSYVPAGAVQLPASAGPAANPAVSAAAARQGAMLAVRPFHLISRPPRRTIRPWPIDKTLSRPIASGPVA